MSSLSLFFSAPEMRPRTVWRCHPIALAISSMVAPSGHCSSPMTRACFEPALGPAEPPAGTELTGNCGHLAEFGIVAARGPGGVTAAVTALHEAQDGLPTLARQVLYGLIAQMAHRRRDHQGRKADHGVASRECRQSAFGDDPGDRPDHGQRHRGGGAGCHTISIRPPIR